MNPPVLSANGIVKRFGNTTILDHIDVAVHRGEVLALVGPSGCGKSTLLNILSGLLTPDAGQLAVDGIPAPQVSDWRRIAYMFQEDRLLPWRTVRDNVAFGLEASPLSRADRRRRADDMLELVGLHARGDAWPHELSGGMRSRVALARSLAVKPEVLLMDEPFSKLDPQTRSQMHEELLRIQAGNGMTVVFVTHDMEEAVVLADRVIRLAARPGRVAEVVNLADLVRPRVPTAPVVAEQVRVLRAAA
ncbi:ABC transporter ATP-binding protein [Cupriavidus pauculus]|uniref:Nitrate/sulfonate/bicarbonate ABC transporter ATP-binding protein n=1 Tax=Cupriavidus pauculus TaxID=82633 RepID=A0A2N5CDD3_9BURK|nr:ABC transporter ATP-binding protein [Cupriavidus pauculus]PLQ00229.1 nitrate/sulfonate/bicarbonate ABC transporter ATP-binding protein [Cupriavidus pauculus]